MAEYVEVAALPKCSFDNSIEDLEFKVCSTDEHNAEYDFRTIWGFWASGCQEAFEKVGNGLGTGNGQKLVVK